MTISTIRAPKRNFSTVLMYVIGIIGIALVVFFGGEVIKNLDNLKGKSALTADVLNGSADVYINDEFVGPSPLETEDITPGYNKITLKTESRQYETSINFIANSTKYIHNVGIFRDLGVSDTFSSGQEFWFEKDKTDGVLRVVSEPTGATVYIDNTQVGQTPYSASNLSDGSYDLRVEYTGHELQTARINVKKGYVLNVALKLFPSPVPAIVASFEGSPGLFDVPTASTIIAADTQAWAKAVIYWNTTRGINLEGSGVNKERVFDYYLDYKGNIFDSEGKPVMDPADLEKLADAEKGAYLGRTSDGPGLTTDAKEAFETLMGVGLGGKKATILETGLGWLRVRDAAGLAGKEVAKVDVGKEYPVVEEQTGWVKIKVDDTTEGWVSSTYVEVKE